MSNTTTSSQPDNSKTIAIISYITLIGWIIALVMHNSNKSKLGAYHLRQMLGLMIVVFVAWIALFILGVIFGILGIALLFNLLVFVGWIVQLGFIAFMVIGAINASKGEEKPLPVIGEMIQQKLAKIFAV